MKIAIGILDTSNNTDVIVIVDTMQKTLTWIPRDLYCFYFKRKVNAAYRIGGHKLFVRVLTNLGFYADESLIFPFQSTAKIINEISIKIDISTPLEFYYPLTLGTYIEEGKKIIYFNPPSELLSGERIHQYIGARYRTDPKAYNDFPDFERIKRQQHFIKTLLQSHFDFTPLLSETYFCSNIEVLNELKKVTDGYQFHLFHHVMMYERLGINMLLIKKPFKLIWKLRFIISHRALLKKAFLRRFKKLFAYFKSKLSHA